MYKKIVSFFSGQSKYNTAGSFTRISETSTSHRELDRASDFFKQRCKESHQIIIVLNFTMCNKI